MRNKASLKGLQIEVDENRCENPLRGLGTKGSMNICAENWLKAKRRSIKSLGRTSTGLYLKEVFILVFDMTDEKIQNELAD